MNPDRRDEVTERHHKGDAPQKKENEVQDQIDKIDKTVSKMSERTADALFGQPSTVNDFERDMYELHKLADRVLEAVAATGAQEMAFREAKKLLPYDRPESLSPQAFTLPMPSWADA